MKVLIIKRKVIILVSLLLVIGGSIFYLNYSSKNKIYIDANNNLILIVRSKLISIYIEKDLYFQNGNKHLFTHFIIQNNTNNQIGVDLSDYNRVLYLNQYGASDSEQNFFMDEKRLNSLELDEVIKEKILTNYKYNKLTIICGKQSFDYYHDFNGLENDKELIEKNRNKFFLMSMGGQLFITDGSNIENIIYDYYPKPINYYINAFLSIPFPIRWKNIPKNSVIIESR